MHPQSRGKKLKLARILAQTTKKVDSRTRKSGRREHAGPQLLLVLLLAPGGPPFPRTGRHDHNENPSKQRISMRNGRTAQKILLQKRGVGNFCKAGVLDKSIENCRAGDSEKPRTLSDSRGTPTDGYIAPNCTFLI